MSLKGLGLDIVEIKRFKVFKKSSRFLVNNFTEEELRYCFSFKDSAVHLAGTFAAKEAVRKALEGDNILLSLIEIRRIKTGRPFVWIKKYRQPILISISHTNEIAIAVAIQK